MPKTKYDPTRYSSDGISFDAPCANCGHPEAHHVITSTEHMGRYEPCRLKVCGCSGWKMLWPEKVS